MTRPVRHSSALRAEIEATRITVQMVGMNKARRNRQLRDKAAWLRTELASLHGDDDETGDMGNMLDFMQQLTESSADRSRRLRREYQRRKRQEMANAIVATNDWDVLTGVTKTRRERK